MMREIAKSICGRILEKRSDVVAVYIVGSVARGDIHEQSDIDIEALINQEDFEGEEFKEGSFDVGIAYIPLKLWKKQLYSDIGSEWENNAAAVVDALILHDPNGLVEKAKKDFRPYPEEKRRSNTKTILDRLNNITESVWYHWVNKNYDIESIFSKFYAMDALRILFPINKVYLKADKFLFKQLGELQHKPDEYVEKCLDLLHFRSKNVRRSEAAWIINRVSETKKTIENMINEMGLLKS